MHTYHAGSTFPSLALALVVLILPIVTIVYVGLTPSSLFRATSSNKLLWIVLPFVLGFFAVIIFWSLIFPRLRATKQELS